jgi:hypothetical protein
MSEANRMKNGTILLTDPFRQRRLFRQRHLPRQARERRHPNAGGNWIISVIAPAVGVTCLAASSDCTRLLAGVSNGLLYASANMGTNWTALASSQAWSGAWLSSDGSKLAATVSTSGSINGGFYSAVIPPLPTTTTNSITGSQGGAVELQYIGNGQFMPVSSTGSIWAN